MEYSDEVVRAGLPIGRRVCEYFNRVQFLSRFMRFVHIEEYRSVVEKSDYSAHLSSFKLKCQRYVLDSSRKNSVVRVLEPYRSL